jgi:hypothetical protein
MQGDTENRAQRARHNRQARQQVVTENRARWRAPQPPSGEQLVLGAQNCADALSKDEAV